MIRLLFSILILCSVTRAVAADKWSIGFNEPLIQQYALSQGVTCPLCPSNMTPRSFSLINSTVLDLAANQHVGTYREILSAAMIEPNFPGDTSNYAVLDAVMDMYKNYNLRVVLAIGKPLPNWALSTASGTHSWCPLPPGTSGSDANFEVVKNNLSWIVSRYLKHLWDRPGYQAWMPNYLIIEGFNEFDGINFDCGAADSGVRGSPARAAALQGGIAWGMNYYGVTARHAMPSIVGVYGGYPSMSAPDAMKQYVLDYYAAGGIGQPNIHIYGDYSMHTTATPVIDHIRHITNTVNQGLPPALQGQIILGEVGAGDRVNNCGSAAPSLPIAAREDLYVGIAQDPTIAAATNAILFWRLANLPVGNLPGCEPYFGVMHDDMSGYKGVGLRLFNYLKN